MHKHNDYRACLTCATLPSHSPMCVQCSHTHYNENSIKHSGEFFVVNRHIIAGLSENVFFMKMKEFYNLDLLKLLIEKCP